MDNLLLMIVLAILFFLIGAGIAGYLAFKRGQTAGIETERTRQEGIRLGAEQEAARIMDSRAALFIAATRVNHRIDDLEYNTFCRQAV